MTFYAGVSTTNSRGAVVRTWPGPGVDFLAAVHPYRPHRREFHDVPEGLSVFELTLSADPGCKVDDRFIWGTHTLTALGPSADVSAAGAAFKVYCQEVS